MKLCFNPVRLPRQVLCYSDLSDTKENKHRTITFKVARPELLPLRSCGILPLTSQLQFLKSSLVSGLTTGCFHHCKSSENKQLMKTCEFETFGKEKYGPRSQTLQDANLKTLNRSDCLKQCNKKRSYNSDLLLRQPCLHVHLFLRKTTKF